MEAIEDSILITCWTISFPLGAHHVDPESRSRTSLWLGALHSPRLLASIFLSFTPLRGIPKFAMQVTILHLIRGDAGFEGCSWPTLRGVAKGKRKWKEQKIPLSAQQNEKSPYVIIPLDFPIWVTGNKQKQLISIALIICNHVSLWRPDWPASFPSFFFFLFSLDATEDHD